MRLATAKLEHESGTVIYIVQSGTISIDDSGSSATLHFIYLDSVKSSRHLVDTAYPELYIGKLRNQAPRINKDMRLFS